MAKTKAKAPKRLCGGLERSDLSNARMPETSFIAEIQRPVLNDKAAYVKGGFERGVSLRDLIRGSGLKTRQVLRLCGMEPDEHIELVAELEKFRTNLLNNRE